MSDDREAGSSAEKTQGYTKKTLGWDRLSIALGRLWSALWGKIFIVAVAFLIIILLFQSYSFVNKRSHQLIKEVPLHCNTSEHYTLAVAYPEKIWIEEKDTPARFIMVSITQPFTASVTPVTFTVAIHHQKVGVIFSDDKGKPLPAELTLIPNQSKKLYVSHLPLAAPIAVVPVSMAVSCNAIKNILPPFNFSLEGKFSAGFRRFFELLLGPTTILLAVVGTLTAMGFKLWEEEEKRRRGEYRKRIDKEEKEKQKAHKEYKRIAKDEARKRKAEEEKTEQAKIGIVRWSPFLTLNTLRLTQNRNFDWFTLAGLKFNPFYPSHTELDARTANYAVSPPIMSPVFSLLQSPALTAVFGASGSGKTAAARWLGSNCNWPPGVPTDSFLSAYCPLFLTEEQPADCFSHLAYALAQTLIAFFAVNRHTFILLSNDQKLAVLRLFIRAFGSTDILTRKLEQLKTNFPEAELQKIAVAPEDIKKRLPLLIEDIKAVNETAKPLFSDAPLDRASRLRLLSVTKYTGLEATFLMADVKLTNIDKQTLKKAAEYVQTLLNYTADLSSIGIYVKLFLPTQLQPHLRLPACIPVETIVWSDDELKKMLEVRAQAAGLDGVKKLFNSREVLNPEETFVEIARGSPRKMLNFGNQLIMRHITQSPTEPKISGKLFYGLAKEFLKNEPA